MKLKSLTLGLATAAAIFVAGCTANQTVSEESLGLRKTDIYTEATTTGDKTMYGKIAAGESMKFERAYENAPPMIPHDVEGMLPITIDNNACVGCHEPAVAASMGATPIPKSHFTDFRPATTLSADGKIVKNGKTIRNTSDLLVSEKSLSELSGTRFNCSQCHAPQSTGKLAVESVFQPDFRTSDLKDSSNLVDVITEGVK